MSKHKGLVAIALAILLVLSGSMFSPVAADSLDDWYDDLERIIQDRQEAEKQLENLESGLATLLLRLDRLSTELESAYDLLTSLQREVEKLDGKIAAQEQLIEEKEAEIAETEEWLEENMGYLEGRLRTMYLDGSVSYLEVLMSATSFSDFVTRFIFLRRIVESDANLVAEIRETRDWLEAERIELEKQREELVANRARVEESRKKAAAEEQRIRGLVAENEQLHSEMKAKKAETSELIAMLEREGDELEEKIYTAEEERRILSGDPPSVLRWPVPVWTRVTSSYGSRTYWNSYLRRWVSDFHRGIDIGTPRSYWPEFVRSSGTISPQGPDYPSYIVAAASGTVSRSQWLGSYGYMVEIEHGGGMATRYAHLDKASNLQVGDTVSMGDIIGILGTTGNSTGPHLHFEVLIYNSSTRRFETSNPLDYNYIGR